MRKIKSLFCAGSLCCALMAPCSSEGRPPQEAIRDLVTASVLYCLHPSLLPAAPLEVTQVFRETAAGFTAMLKGGAIDLSPDAWPMLQKLDYSTRAQMIEQSRNVLIINNGISNDVTQDWKGVDSLIHKPEWRTAFLKERPLLYERMMFKMPGMRL